MLEGSRIQCKPRANKMSLKKVPATASGNVQSGNLEGDDKCIRPVGSFRARHAVAPLGRSNHQPRLQGQHTCHVLMDTGSSLRPKPARGHVRRHQVLGQSQGSLCPQFLTDLVASVGSRLSI